MKRVKIMKRMTALLFALALCVTLLPMQALAATAPTKITLSAKTALMGVGETKKLTATLTPKGATSKLTWTTSDSKVATVKDGTIKAIKTGKATITVKTANKLTATCTVTVSAAPKKVTLDKASITIGVKQTYKLVSTLTAKSAGAVTWKTSNKAVATVSGGKVTAVKAGTAKITVTTYNKLTATCTVKVVAAPTSIKLSNSTLNLGVKETKTLTKTLMPATAAAAFTWTSSKPAVATVNSSGKVTAVKAGTTTITLKTHNGITAKCTVNVKAAPTKVTLSAVTIGVGVAYTLKPKLSDNSYGSVTYKSATPAVAKVNATTGVVTGVAKGTAKITATTYNGRTSTATVTVDAGAPVNGSISQIVEYYNKAANASKSTKNFTATRKETMTGEILEGTNTILKTIAVGAGLLDTVNDSRTNTYVFKNGVTTDGKSAKDNLPVMGQNNMSSLKASYVKSATLTKSGSTYVVNIKLKDEKVIGLADAKQYHSCMDTIDVGLDQIAEYGEIDGKNTTSNYKNGSIKAVVNTAGKLNSVTLYEELTIYGKVRAPKYLVNNWVNANVGGSYKQDITFKW